MTNSLFGSWLWRLGNPSMGWHWLVFCESLPSLSGGGFLTGGRAPVSTSGLPSSPFRDANTTLRAQP